MNIARAEPVEFQNVKSLKALLSAQGPCVTAYMPLEPGNGNQSGKVNSLRWRELIRTLETKREALGEQGRSLAKSLEDWEAVAPEGEPKGRSVAAFRSPDVFQVTWVDDRVATRAEAGPHFYVRPLLRDLTRDREFYLLALSQRNMRLLRCTTHDSEELPLPEVVPTSFDRFMNTEKPDHTTENRSSPGPSSGTSKGVTFTTSSDREDKGEFLGHFFRQIDRGVNEVLRGKTEPLVIAAVEYEIALYRTLNKYPHLAAEAVEGAPNGLKAGEMHARALDALERCYEKKVDQALGDYNHLVGGGASNRLKEIVPASHDGRVLTLLVSDSLETPGAFDEATHTVKGRQTGGPEDEDLVNDAVVQTILHAGQVYVVPNSKMPNGAPVAAIYRF